MVELIYFLSVRRMHHVMVTVLKQDFPKILIMKLKNANSAMKIGYVAYKLSLMKDFIKQNFIASADSFSSLRVASLLVTESMTQKNDY